MEILITYINYAERNVNEISAILIKNNWSVLLSLMKC